tara:strand:- start:195 stop:467 length:273 start_codon:yes stop_codon:yes gene_type:complete
MKKLLYLFLTVLIVACSSDDDSNSVACLGQDALLAQYEDAALAFASSPSSTTCQAYISSLELFIQCAEGLSVSELEQFQQIVDAVDCSIY